jgi:hypothetical protein
MASKNLDGNLVKKANVAQRFSEQDIADLMKCQDPDTGPAYFLENFFYIQHPTKGKIQYAPFKYQKRLLDSYHKHRFSVNMLGRQLGKCLTSEINISITNKVTKKVYDIPIVKLYEYEYAKKHGLPIPDISQYERKDV